MTVVRTLGVIGWGWVCFLVMVGCNHLSDAQQAARREYLAPPATGRPNIILINLDDADRDCVEIDLNRPGTEPPLLPHFKRLAQEGIRFTNFHTAVPICNPSRVSLLTGQYAFKTGVRCNMPSSRTSMGTPGGFLPFRNSGPFGDASRPHIRNEIGTWMQQAGYHTMHVGKFLHDHFEAQPGEEFSEVVPQGWNDFYCSFGATYFSTMFYKNGSYTYCKSADPLKYPIKYRGEIERIDAVDLVTRQLQQPDRPFFLYFAPLAPHREEAREFDPEETREDQGMVDNRYQDELPDLQQVRDPNFDEEDNSDKPTPVRQMDRLRRESNDPRINDERMTDLDFRRRILSLKNVDAALGDLLDVLERQGATEKTVIFLTSDHGYALGHFRHLGKSLPYDRITKVPAIAWGPGIIQAKPGDYDPLLSTIDLAPTLLDIAGGRIPEVVQGKSFWPLLNGTQSVSAAEWRPEGLLVEHWEESYARPRPVTAAYALLRLHHEVYTQWYTGEEEYYDLASDPWQLQNRFGELDEARRQALRAGLQRQRDSMPAPESFLSAPLHDNHVFFRAAILTGMSEYKVPLKEVNLQISQTVDGQQEYWNGRRWSDQPTDLKAELDSSTTILTGWNYRFAPRGFPLGRFFQVRVSAVGMDGVEQRTPLVKTFQIDPELPLSQVTGPQFGVTAKLHKVIKVTGNARSNTGFKSIEIAIQDDRRSQYWNGQEWQTDPVFLPTRVFVRGNEFREWEYDFQPKEPKGQAWVTVRLTADSGETDSYPPDGSLIQWSR